MKKILIAPSSFASVDTTPIDRLSENDFQIVNNPFGRKLTCEELIRLLPGVEGIIAGLETLNRKILENSELKVISRCGAGLSNIDIAAAKELGIKIFSTPDAPTNSVAELTVGAILSLIRHVVQMNSRLHKAEWSKQIGFQLEGKTVTIIGFGRIGRKIAEFLKSFKAKIIAVDPAYSGCVDGVPVLSLNEVLHESDIITIHISGEQTVLGEKQFALMKKGIFLLNCSRGNVIDEKQLMHALDTGKVTGAWLDCFSCEPYVGPLTKYEQVILTPHIGSYTVECRKRMEIEAADNIIRFFREK